MNHTNKTILPHTLLLLVCTCIFILVWGCANTKETTKEHAAPKDNTKNKETTLAVKYDYGYSAEKRKIQGYVIGEGEDVILIIATIHGDESSGTPLVDELKKYLADKPNLLQGRKVVIMNNVNPDGMIRERRENARGIDINHDFSSQNPQPETKAIQQTIKFFKPDRIISIRQLNSIDYDGPAAERLAEHLRQNCDLRIKRWGTRAIASKFE